MGAIIPVFGSIIVAAGFIVAVVAIDAIKILVATLQQRPESLSNRTEAPAAKPISVVQRVVVVSLSILGAYYIFLGLVTLWNLQSVTHRWIELSGDSDFKWDFPLFLVCIGTGATIVTLFGLATTASGIITALGKPSAGHWNVLAIVAPLLHFPWFFYRVIATGSTAIESRSEAGLTIRLFAIRCGVICASYVLLWLLTRHKSVTPSAA